MTLSYGMLKESLLKRTLYLCVLHYIYITKLYNNTQTYFVIITMLYNAFYKIIKIDIHIHVLQIVVIDKHIFIIP